jgi:hypothetical protein
MNSNSRSNGLHTGLHPASSLKGRHEKNAASPKRALKDGDFTTAFSIDEHDADGLLATECYLPNTSSVLSPTYPPSAQRGSVLPRPSSVPL